MAKYGLTPQGPNPKRLDVILEDMHSKMTERLGVNTRQNPQSLLNHTLTNVADEIAELWEFGVDVYHSQYTSSATGVSLDYAAQFGGSTREMAAKSYYSILCTGLDGTTIPAGTVIASDTNPATSLTATADATITRSAFNKATVILASPAATTALGVALNGNLYTITPDPKQSTSEALEALGTAITDKDFHVTVINDTIVIEAVDETSSNTLVLSENLTTASVGSIVTFETAEPGDIFIPNGVITKITKAVPGMESVVNVGSYVAGQLAESDVEFRKSYTNKIYNRSSAMLESIKSAILKNVQGVVSVAPYENCTNEVDSAGRWPHSIEVVVEGGDATEIAQQILNTKAGGINTFGSVETTLHGVYGEDIVVRFNRPTYVKVWFKVGVTLSPNTNPPTNYVELVKEQILEKMSVLGAGENVIPQKFNLQVSGIDYIDVWLFATPNDGDMPTGYTQRSVSISARERAVTDENRTWMADYVQKLRDDLVEQFKGKPVIDALMEAVGDELNEVRQFYEDLRDKRNIQTAVGKQLDGIGDNAVLTRLEAGALACAKESVYVLDDDAYRTYLIYKIWKNTNNCTYYDIIRAFKMFWDKPLHYREDPAIPATMIFETDDLTPEADVSKLLNAPFIKAAGVAILVVANTAAPEMVADVPVEGILGRGYTTTTLPEIETGEAFIGTVLPVPAAQNITQTKLPELEEDEL